MGRSGNCEGRGLVSMLFYYEFIGINDPLWLVRSLRLLLVGFAGECARFACW